jgi:hypothetical protein
LQPVNTKAFSGFHTLCDVVFQFWVEGIEQPVAGTIVVVAIVTIVLALAQDPSWFDRGLELKFGVVLDDGNHLAGVLWVGQVCDRVQPIALQICLDDFSEVEEMCVVLMLGYKADLSLCSALL